MIISLIIRMMTEDKNKLKKVMEENHEAYSRIDSDTRNMLEVVANIKIPEECKLIEEGKERYDMCKAFEDMRQELAPIKGRMPSKVSLTWHLL